MASKRVFEIAKELGVKSKSIVDKCHAEGIPSEVIKNHMSTVSIGLEQTIREWFTADEGSSTAVEQADKVDLDKVRDDKPRKARKVSSDDADGEDDAGTTTAVVDAPKAAPLKARPVGTPPSGGETPVEPAAKAGAPVANKPSATRMPAGLNDRPPVSDEPVAPARSTAMDDRPDAGKPSRVVRPPSPSIKGPEAPPVMNVPTRPKVITPAGPKLEEIKKDKIKLSGPKGGRVEAPERLEPPCPPRGPRPG